MTLRQRIDFTERELEALTFVLAKSGSVVIHERAIRGAAGRAKDKIDRAYRKATTGSTADPDVFCNRCDNRGKNVPGPGNQNFGCPGCGYTLGEHPNRIQT
jgi:hypothetical protein